MEEKNTQTKQIKSNFIKNILICTVLLIVVLLCFWAFNTGARGSETTYGDLLTKIEAGSVKQIEIGNKYIIAEYNDGSYYWVYNSNDVGAQLIEKFSDGTFDLNTITVITGSPETFDILNLLYPILLVATMIIVLMMIMKQVGASNNKTFDFVKNRARVMPSKVKFADVAGADEEKAELEEIIEFLKAPDRFIKMGARIPKGVLLVGPPGTGKTLLAKACAGEANVPFFTISGSDFMELFVGVGASRVRDLFETAKKAKPCIVFIDEIDAIGRQRGAGLGGGNDEREQTLNQLLVQMDGFEANEGIIVLAATNRADILDPALLRPGRFDRRVLINTPDVAGREEILKVHAKGKPIADDVNLKVIARITSGFTGADIENMLNESALLAAKNNQKEINMQNINDAITKVTMGPQKRSSVITQKDKRITAVHESGHAIIGKCVKNSDPIHEVSIVPRGGAGGYTLSRPETDDRHVQKSKLLDIITMMLGGRMAEKLFLDDISTGASNDIERATNIARSMVTQWGMSDKLGLVSFESDNDQVFIGRDYATRTNYSEKEAAIIDEEIKNIINSCAQEAQRILNENKEKLHTMVEILLEKETIYQDEVDMIMQGKSKDEIMQEISQKVASSEVLNEKKLDVDELIKRAEAKEKDLQNANNVTNSNVEGTETLKETGEEFEKKASEKTSTTKPEEKEENSETSTSKRKYTKKADKTDKE